MCSELSKSRSDSWVVRRDIVGNLRESLNTSVPPHFSPCGRSPVKSDLEFALTELTTAPSTFPVIMWRIVPQCTMTPFTFILRCHGRHLAQSRAVVSDQRIDFQRVQTRQYAYDIIRTADKRGYQPFLILTSAGEGPDPNALALSLRPSVPGRTARTGFRPRTTTPMCGIACSGNNHRHRLPSLMKCRR